MSNNQMVSVPRELVEFAVGFKRNGHKNLTDQRSDQDNAQDKLRVLLERAAEQHQVEPVGYVRAGNLRNLRLVAHCAAIEMTGVPRRDGDVPLYTHADHAEVERLRDQLAAWQALAAERLEVTTGLRAQLAEAHSLLHEVGASGFMVDGQILPSNEALELQDRVDSALCASTEPRPVIA